MRTATRGLDLEPSDTLLRLLARGLGNVSDQIVALASQASPEIGDAISFAVKDLDKNAALVEILSNRAALNRKEKMP